MQERKMLFKQTFQVSLSNFVSQKQNLMLLEVRDSEEQSQNCATIVKL